MILYHGSNVAIDHIELEKSKPFKDFGQGFYLSENERQALDMAHLKHLHSEENLLYQSLNLIHH